MPMYRVGGQFIASFEIEVEAEDMADARDIVKYDLGRDSMSWADEYVDIEWVGAMEE